MGGGRAFTLLMKHARQVLPPPPRPPCSPDRPPYPSVVAAAACARFAALLHLFRGNCTACSSDACTDCSDFDGGPGILIQSPTLMFNNTCMGARERVGGLEFGRAWGQGLAV